VARPFIVPMFVVIGMVLGATGPSRDLIVRNATPKGAAGRVYGHSGAGPGSVNTVCHFPDLPTPVTVAVFTDGEDEGAPEFEALAIARREQA